MAFEFQTVDNCYLSNMLKAQNICDGQKRSIT